MTHSHNEIELRAYRLWELRGHALGSPETDWFEAERQLTAAPPHTPLLEMAREVGGAIGSIVALLSDAPKLT